MFEAVGILFPATGLAPIGTILLGAGGGSEILGGILGSVNSGPWNEQSPAGVGSAGTVNTGVSIT